MRITMTEEELFALLEAAYQQFGGFDRRELYDRLAEGYPAREAVCGEIALYTIHTWAYGHEPTKDEG